MAFGTGSAEYLIILGIFVALAVITLYLLGTKTYKEKGIYWSTYHNFFTLLFIFFGGKILRIFNFKLVFLYFHF